MENLAELVLLIIMLWIQQVLCLTLLYQEKERSWYFESDLCPSQNEKHYIKQVAIIQARTF